MTYFHFERSLDFSMAEVVITNAGAGSFCVLIVLSSFSILLFHNFIPLHSDPLIVLDDQKTPK